MSAGRPPIVCLLGSTRFRDEYEAANRRLTLEGKIVLTCGVWVHHEAERQNDPDTKAGFDWLHLRKIDLADGVHVINPGGYMGESTRRELAYAERNGKPVSYLEEPGAPPEAGKVVHVLSGMPYDVYVGRRNGRRGLPSTIWENPFKIDEHRTREQALDAYERHVRRLIEHHPTEWDITALRGLTLACWCAPKDRALTVEDATVCHGQILLMLAEEIGS